MDQKDLLNELEQITRGQIETMQTILSWMQEVRKIIADLEKRVIDLENAVSVRKGPN